MSADRQRLTSAIRRIAKTDPEIRGLLKAADNKGGKPGAAGVGSSTEAQQARICCDGSISDNPNPGTDERDPDADGAGQSGGLNGDDPALLDMGEGTLSGVTDCATGEPICFDGSGFIPPDGWDAPDDPPIDPNYDPAYYWVGDSSEAPAKNFQLCNEARAYALSSLPCNVTMAECGDFFFASRSGDLCGDGTTYEVFFGRQPCSGEAICSEEPPLATEWPSDGCNNLAIKNGKIVGSKYDPENDGSYSAPRDSIDLCDGNGNQISLAPAVNGGWKTINSTNDNGYLYDSSGRQIAHIDGNEYSDPSV